MQRTWNDTQPIHRQVRDRVADLILDGVLGDGDPLPPVRNIATEYRLNPLTVLKAYQQLGEEELVETNRERGPFITRGARALLLRVERDRFLTEQWPPVRARVRRLELKPEELFAEC